MAKRVFLIVLDSFGIGKSPDAHLFGDLGADTLGSLSKSGELNIPNMIRLGLGSVDGVECLERVEKPEASLAALCEKSAAKDTTVGHWELMGIVSGRPFPVYPDGFPKSVTDEFSERVGRGVLCNLPYSGTDVIRDYGEEHLKTGDLIVYTSADSVFQIAAHESVMSVEELYRVCGIARKMLVGEHAVGRVIARPFKTEGSRFVRTDARRDFSIEPPEDTVLDVIKAQGKEVIGVGKISDIFAGRGLSESFRTHSNAEGMACAESLLDRDFIGLCFVNLVDFDSSFGHRRDLDGYARAISEFDRWLGGFIAKMSDGDALIITADHGCDPLFGGTDHTRERVPMLLYEKGKEGINYGTKDGFGFVGETVLSLLKQ